MRTALITIILLFVSCSTDSNNLEPEDVLHVDTTADIAAGDSLAEEIPERPPAEPVVFAVISDTHVWGSPEHTASKRLTECLTTIGGLDPLPEFLIVSGDLVNDVYGHPEADLTPHELFSTLIEDSPVPVFPVAGNHDYYAQETPEFELVDAPEEAEQIHADILGIEPYYSKTITGTRFILLNSARGPLWDLTGGLSGSFGEEQLLWLEQELAEGLPTVLFFHHPPDLIHELEGTLTLEDVVTAHQNQILAMFAGHLHLWSKGEFAGVPLFLTAANQDGVAFHHVATNPTEGTVTILNEDDIDYGEPILSECSPADHAPINDLSGLAQSVHHLVLQDAVAEPAGFAEYVEEGLAMMPMLVRFGQLDPGGMAIPALFSIGNYYGNAVGGLPPYIETLHDGPCVAFDMLVTDPCFLHQPFTITVDLSQAFSLPLPADWKVRLRLSHIEFQGRFTAANTPLLVDGIVTLVYDLNPTKEDMENIIIEAYCNDEIADCSPGTENMPACPEKPSAAFFPEVPVTCDVKAMGFGLRMLYTIINQVPDGTGTLTATYSSRLPDSSTQPVPGGYESDLFSIEAGGNCTH
jgi:hypothetical protein